MKARSLARLGLSGLIVLGWTGCSTPTGEYGGVWTQDYSGPYGSHSTVVKSEQVGTAFGPWGGMYNYEEVTFGPPSS